MSNSDLIRKYFSAYENKDRKVVESLLSHDFVFTSPYDYRIDRQTYFKRCWPYSEQSPTYEIYGKAMTFAEELPVYASKVQQTVEPISKKIQTFQQSAGNLVNDVHATKKVPEVRLQESPTWPAYLVRGVGSVWGALIVAGVVPFLTFFMLCTKDQMPSGWMAFSVPG
jgi:hypothetical protein